MDKKLEQRVARLERQLNERKGLHRTDELLGGVIGKTNANKDDRKKVIDLLKEKLNLDDDNFYISDFGDFRFSFAFYKDSELEDAIDKVDVSFKPDIITKCYSLSVEDTEKDKIVVRLDCTASKQRLISSSMRNVSEVQKNKPEVLGEEKGLTILSKGKLVNNIISLLKKNSINTSDIVAKKKGDDTIFNALDKAKTSFMQGIVKELEADSVLERIDWWFDNNEIRGEFYIKDAGRENGKYRVTVDLENDCFYMLYSVERDKVLDKGKGNSDIKNLMRKVIVANINNRGKMSPKEESIIRRSKYRIKNEQYNDEEYLAAYNDYCEAINKAQDAAYQLQMIGKHDHEDIDETHFWEDVHDGLFDFIPKYSETRDFPQR